MWKRANAVQFQKRISSAAPRNHDGVSRNGLFVCRWSSEEVCFSKRGVKTIIQFNIISEDCGFDKLFSKKLILRVMPIYWKSSTLHISENTKPEKWDWKGCKNVYACERTLMSISGEFRKYDWIWISNHFQEMCSNK